MLKYILFISLALFVSLTNCRKKELNNTPIESNNQSTCFNGIKDGDETDIDCGGSCGTCVYLDVPCAIGKDTLNFFFSNSTDFVIDSTSYIQNQHYVVTGYFKPNSSTANKVTITIFGTPNGWIEYTNGNATSLNTNEADIELDMGSNGIWDGYGGTVYIQPVIGGYSVTACNYTFSKGFGTASGKVNFSIPN